MLISTSSVNVLVVVGSERLYSDMLRRFNGQPIGIGETTTVIKLDRSGGSVDRDEDFLRRSRKAQFLRYFYGDPKMELHPRTTECDFSHVTIYRVPNSESALKQLRIKENQKPPILIKPQPQPLPTSSPPSSQAAKPKTTPQPNASSTKKWYRAHRCRTVSSPSSRRTGTTHPSTSETPASSGSSKSRRWTRSGRNCESYRRSACNCRGGR